MTDKLKSAIITIAEYMGWTLTPNGFIQNLLDAREQYFTQINHFKYHTSADALLEVWRKVRDEVGVMKEYYKRIHYAVKVQDIGQFILNKKYPAACELLAEIINELKQKP